MEEKINIGGQSARIVRRNTTDGLFYVFDKLNLNSQPRTVEVFLPPSYRTSKKRYPVIYMNDGQTAFEPGGLSPWYWNVDTTLDKFYKEEIISELIVVAVTPISRADEYLTIKEFLDFDNNVVELKGGLPEYADYLANDLKPFIDANLRTRPNPKSTMIIGSSFGGTASFYTSCFHPDAFGIGAVFSPSFTIGAGLQLNPQPIEETDYIKDILKTLTSDKLKPRLWIDWGGQEGDTGEKAMDVIEILKDKVSYKENKDLFFMEDEIATHDERAWAYRFGLIVKQFYAK